MDLQVALDRIPLDRAVSITTAVAPRTDWVEVGTSLIKQFGQEGLRQVVAAAGRTPVLADLKTADDVRFEFETAFAAGARSVTVLGLAPQVSIDLAVQVTGEHDAELVVDLMGLTPQRIEELAERLPHHVRLAPHVSKDSQAGGQRPQDLLGAWSRGRRLALAGGLTAQDLPGLADEPELRVIVGSAVTKADDPVVAIEELRRAAGKDN
ncbi:orotidine 5'-phosphate decarboxylase / HUMPS family protein [Nocardioides panaciterrulae]|uniref:3-hexulose-6-phosphate synthase n=1 Tax=Nocardioides panaciterrulae TaxID=661492 RepID=A0A7Y9JC21_9ACTN|nr:orotidine 5'-phosphate decarboxylase / HUMPS family protein [Nocardioides panaciterrulae]NYD42968.1 3-hexulose-6-phosphate synthase [Nocardioides panaciterrulae]